MVRLTPIHVAAGAGNHLGSIPLTAIGLFISVVSALVALCVKHSRRASRSSKHATEPPNDSKFAPRSDLRSPPTKLVTPIGEKAILVAHHRKTAAEEAADAGGDEAEEGFGEASGGGGGGGLWQKTILMGEKCQPPEFSGVIYYDCGGNRISELPPRSPRASPLRSFSPPAN